MSAEPKFRARPSCSTEFEDECTWYPHRVVARVLKHGERREQVWMGRDANHALERAACVENGVMWPAPDEVKATRMWGDDE